MKVSAFSTWEKELHKIVFDPRYLLLNPKERKQVKKSNSLSFQLLQVLSKSSVNFFFLGVNLPVSSVLPGILVMIRGCLEIEKAIKNLVDSSAVSRYSILMQ